MAEKAVKMPFFGSFFKLSANFFSDVACRSGKNHFSHKYNHMAIQKIQNN